MPMKLITKKWGVTLVKGGKKVSINVSTTARKFMREKGIEDVTFRLLAFNIAGCMGMVREIDHRYDAP